jgi:archaellum biogenesis ATPase FlaH
MEDKNKQIQFTDLSKELIPDLQKSAIMYVIGTKRAGKTIFAFSILHRCLTNDYFHNYILILAVDPKLEQKNTYGWIDNIAKEKKKKGIKVLMHNEFDTEAIINFLIEERKKERRTLIIADDMTQNNALFHASSKAGGDIKRLLSQIRHLYASTIFIVHSATSVLNSVVKNLADYVALMISPSLKVLQGIWESWLSYKMSKDAFLDMYRNEMETKEYPCILITTFGGSKVDNNCNDWGWLSQSREFILNSLKE